jgi:hypothetical protein
MIWFELFQSNSIDFEDKICAMIWRNTELIEESVTFDLVYSI